MSSNGSSRHLIPQPSSVAAFVTASATSAALFLEHPLQDGEDEALRLLRDAAEAARHAGALFNTSKLDIVDCVLMAKARRENFETFTFDRDLEKEFDPRHDTSNGGLRP